MNFDYTKHNIGNNDRMIRAALGVLLIASVFFGGGWVGGLIGAVLLGTAGFRFCPAYALFDFSTDKTAAPVGK
ncbi:DUF2892 domain-containing protein [Thiorhodococcus mannitoliphagus]|uniref:DUF2892 domain-containing protein n=1 Tax=Thiorhodococcus mannitoliphagus TaxID=329406 RepID=A0A6P1E0A7_9GAMM|nr:DUF2892 domain-containing protein [Thiorhodococcus mannitoliphagus]NEX22713.1 DUF2892 domain-containing protein [Thiorhodococcus mannitoliphagus]